MKCERAEELADKVFGHPWTKLSNGRETESPKGEHSARYLAVEFDADIPRTRLSDTIGEMASPRLLGTGVLESSTGHGELNEQHWLADVKGKAQDHLADQHAIPGMHTPVTFEQNAGITLTKHPLLIESHKANKARRFLS